MANAGTRGHDGVEADLRVRVDIGVARGQPLELVVDGERIAAFEGETVAAALFAAGIRVLRSTAVGAEPRGVFCGMGTCFDCLMIIDSQPSQRACMVPVQDGMVVQTQVGHGEP